MTTRLEYILIEFDQHLLNRPESLRVIKSVHTQVGANPVQVEMVCFEVLFTLLCNCRYQYWNGVVTFTHRHWHIRLRQHTWVITCGLIYIPQGTPWPLLDHLLLANLARKV